MIYSPSSAPAYVENVKASKRTKRTREGAMGSEERYDATVATAVGAASGTG